MKEKERSSLKTEKLSNIMDGEDRKYISKALLCILKENWNMEINRYGKQISEHLRKKHYNCYFQYI